MKIGGRPIRLALRCADALRMGSRRGWRCALAAMGRGLYRGTYSLALAVRRVVVREGAPSDSLPSSPLKIAAMALRRV